MSQYGTVIISEEQLQKRIQELGRQISQDYQGRSLLLVGVLKGCVYFMSDLSRAIDNPNLQIDFIVVSSYGESTSTSGVVKILKDLDKSIEGMDVLIVEDILDTGLTLSYITEIFKKRHPNSVKICTLLNKSARRKKSVAVDYVGFEIDDAFVIGYGLDYAEKYRNLRDILVINTELI